tara:strand:+ start:198 stop:2228 length:2031 start_codon:yes stop_codon:yes gene_type:complete
MNQKDKKKNIKEFLTKNNLQIATVMYENQKITLFDYLIKECEYPIESCLLEELIDDIENNLFNNGKKIPFTQKRYTVKWSKIFGLRDKTEEQESKQEEQIEPEEADKKCKLLAKYAQSGKTGIVTDMISNNIKRKPNKTLSIIACDNSLLLTEQTTSRCHKENYIKPANISSKAKNIDKSTYKTLGQKKNNKSLLERINENEYNTLLMCCNKSRFNDIDTLIRDNGRLSQQYIKDIYIYIDEADKLVTDNTSIMINKWINTLGVKNIVFITATPFSPSSSWKNIKKFIGRNINSPISLVPLTESHGETYHLLSKSNFINYNYETKSPSDYMETYFQNHQTPKNGQVWMIPGTRKTSSHDNIIDIASSFDNNIISTFKKTRLFNAILILNGSRKELLLYNDQNKKWFQEIKCKDMEDYKGNEMKKWLKNIYNKYNGQNKLRLVITGNICISRGITISSSDCNISHMMVSDNCCGDYAEMFQLASRLCGYTRNKNNIPTLICSTQTKNTLLSYEKILQQGFIDKALENDLDISEDKILDLIKQESINRDPNYNPDEWIHSYEKFEYKQNQIPTKNTLEYLEPLVNAINWIENQMGTKYRFNKNKLINNFENNFIKSSISKSTAKLHYDEVNEFCKDIQKGTRRKTSNLDKGGSRLYYTYTNFDDPTSLVIFARILIKK